MARNPRWDPPGSWHHVMNRGIARRSLFECRGDIRYFLACLARAVRRGQIEVHAWCVLTTHFHLLVRSPTGELSAAMRRVQNAYVRRFNRARKRDGPMVRGRFRSKLVTSVVYRTALVRYIDANAVLARLAHDPCAYPFGSAQAYAQESGPPWLTRDWVEELVRVRLGLERYDGRLYPRAFAKGNASTSRYLVERRIASQNTAPQFDDLDDLIEGAPENVLRWLQRKAKLADGGSPGPPMSSPRSVRDRISRHREDSAEWTVRTNRKARCGWDVLEVGLLRDLTAATYREVVGAGPRSTFTAARLYAQHRELLRTDPEYAGVAASVARGLLDDLRA